jgi:hypothetical protein
MPAPISISSNEQAWIKQYLQETYDIAVVDAFDCKALSEAVYKHKGTKISYSTFRRLFDLVPNTNSLSRYVLNALAEAVGFKNWELFKQYVARFDTNVINQNIQVYSRQLPESRTLILDTIKNLPVATWTGGYQFQSIIALAVQNHDFDLLKEIVQLPFDIENPKIYEHLVIGFQSFYFQAIKGNQAMVDFVSDAVPDSVLLQKCLLQAYVDENYLDTFFGRWISAVNDSKILDFKLFKNLLLCQKAVNAREMDKAKMHLSKAYELVLESKVDIHSILKARIGVWNLVLKNDSHAIENQFISLSSPFDKADFAVIASRLLWTYQGEKETLPFLERITLNDFPPVKDFFQKGRYNMLVLTLAIHHYLKQEIQQSKAYFKLFNRSTLGYDIVNIDFYLPWIDRLTAL